VAYPHDKLPSEAYSYSRLAHILFAI